MIIQTLDKAYEVIKKFEENQGRAVYLCQRTRDKERRLYLVTAFAGNALPREHVIFFMELSLSRKIVDLEESFLKNEVLYLVFVYRQDEQLMDALNEGRLSVMERLEISRSLMEQIVSKNLPDYLLYEALSGRNVRVAEDGRVSFNYFMDSPELLGRNLYPDVLNRLYDWLNQLFSQELDGGKAEPLEAFMEEMENQEYHSYVEIYRKYRTVYEWMVKQAGTDGLKPDTFLLKLWKCLKKALKWLHYFLYGAVLAGMLAYLIYSVRKPEEGTGSMPFGQIGAVTIEGEDVPEEAESNPEKGTDMEK